MMLKYLVHVAGALALACAPAVADAADAKHHKRHHTSSIQSAQAAYRLAPTRWQNTVVWAGERVDCDSPNVVTVQASPAARTAVQTRAPIPKVASPLGNLRCELRNQRSNWCAIGGDLASSAAVGLRAAGPWHNWALAAQMRTAAGLA